MSATAAWRSAPNRQARTWPRAPTAVSDTCSPVALVIGQLVGQGKSGAAEDGQRDEHEERGRDPPVAPSQA